MKTISSILIAFEGIFTLSNLTGVSFEEIQRKFINSQRISFGIGNQNLIRKPIEERQRSIYFNCF